MRMRRYGTVLASTIGFLLSGCMVGPRYVKPTVPMTTNFEETEKWKGEDGWKVAQPGDDVIRGKWWELYGDAMLNEIEEQVDPSNQDLKIAEANLRQARAAIRFNRASQAPTIGSSPSISDIRASANKPYFPPSSVNNGSGDFILPFDLSYEVDLWGRVRRSVASARQQAQASAADLQTARLSLHAEVAIDYFEVRSADAQERLLNDTVKAYTEALRLTQTRFEGGASPKSDVAQAKTQLKAAQVLASDITVQRAQYEHALAILIGKPPAEFHRQFLPSILRRPYCPTFPSLCRRGFLSVVQTLLQRNAAWHPPTNKSALPKRLIIRRLIWPRVWVWRALRF